MVMIVVAILGGVITSRVSIKLAEPTLATIPARHPRWQQLSGPIAVCDFTGALTCVSAVWFVGLNLELVVVLALALFLLSLSVVDLYLYRLPDRLVFLGLGVAVCLMVANSLGRGDFEPFYLAAVGMFSYFGLLLAVHLLSHRGLGFGDVKLALLLGLHLGWGAGIYGGGWLTVIHLVFVSQVLASAFGAVGGLAVALIRAKRRNNFLADPSSANTNERLLTQSFPFGPALAAATMIVILYIFAVSV